MALDFMQGMSPGVGNIFLRKMATIKSTADEKDAEIERLREQNEALAKMIETAAQERNKKKKAKATRGRKSMRGREGLPPTAPTSRGRERPISRINQEKSVPESVDLIRSGSGSVFSGEVDEGESPGQTGIKMEFDSHSPSASSPSPESGEFLNEILPQASPSARNSNEVHELEEVNICTKATSSTDPPRKSRV